MQFLQTYPTSLHDDKFCRFFQWVDEGMDEGMSSASEINFDGEKLNKKIKKLKDKMLEKERECLKWEIEALSMRETNKKLITCVISWMVTGLCIGLGLNVFNYSWLGPN